MKQILFVDDEARILEGIRRTMYSERHHWDMEFAVGGAAALQALEKRHFDVVVSDMRMPEMDGITLLRNVRDLFPDTARIILSGYSESSLAMPVASVAHQVLSKPCNVSELRSAIERVCALHDVLSTPELRKIIGAIGSLPSLSTTYSILTKAVENPLTSVEKIAEIIEQDAAMSAKVLQLVNSAFFGLAHNVTSIENAVAYLGIDTIKSLALTSDVFRTFKPNSRFGKTFYEALQKHALRTAAILAVVPLAPKKKETAVLSALLHDIGKLILTCAAPDDFERILSQSEKESNRQFKVEEEVLGTSHAEIGAYLLGLWGINHEVVESIAHHHRPTRVSSPASDVAIAVYLADFLEHELGSDPTSIGQKEISEPDRTTLDSLGLLEKLPVLRKQAHEYMANFSGSLAT